jgi:hypothetical protein
MERQTTPPDPPRRGPHEPPPDPFEEFIRERRAAEGAPPPGWEDAPPGYEGAPPGYEGAPPPPPPGLDPRALFVLLDGLRRVVPRELEGQLTNLIREFLLTLRALIDWYLERLDRPEREPRVEDIPID